jgi:hypothetical protein
MQQSALSPEFFCDVRPDRERVVVRVGGGFDLAVAPHVAATVDELLDAGFARIVIDLRELSFLDSAGVHTGIRAPLRRAARRRPLVAARTDQGAPCAGADRNRFAVRLRPSRGRLSALPAHAAAPLDIEADGFASAVALLRVDAALRSTG